RRENGLMVMVNWLTLGFISWLLVLTLARDIALAAAALALPASEFASWPRLSALWVLWATPAITAVGFLMARRVAPVVRVDIPVAGLPAALEGFTIAQISDVHVGPTIKRPYVESVVAAVNGLDADLVAITGDLVDGSVPALAEHVAPLADLRSRS